jgi:predicted DNA-binding transcriptional regulator YafY
LVQEGPERGGVVITLLAYSLDWLAGWVFSFGAAAEVLSPDRLKRLVASEAENVAAKYGVRRSSQRSVKTMESIPRAGAHVIAQ